MTGTIKKWSPLLRHPCTIESAGSVCCPYGAGPNTGGSGSRATTTAIFHDNTAAFRDPCCPCHRCSCQSLIPTSAHSSQMVSFTSTHEPSHFPGRSCYHQAIHRSWSLTLQYADPMYQERQLGKELKYDCPQSCSVSTLESLKRGPSIRQSGAQLNNTWKSTIASCMTSIAGLTTSKVEARSGQVQHMSPAIMSTICFFGMRIFSILASILEKSSTGLFSRIREKGTTGDHISW